MKLFDKKHSIYIIKL